MPHPVRVLSLFLLGLLCSPPACTAQAQEKNPFKPMTTVAQYARARDYDLQNILLRLTLEPETQSLRGTVIETLAPLRDGLQTLRFDAGKKLTIVGCKVNDTDAKFTHKDAVLTVDAPTPLKRGETVQVTIAYALKGDAEGDSVLGFPAGPVWKARDKFEPERVPMFYTQGETESNHEWVPLYDFPNDKTTADVFVTVPNDWFMVGNGKLDGVEKNPNGRTQTFHWRMTQPFSTYLLSLAGGEMDVVTDKWQDVDLFYVVPKGMGGTIPFSFGDTPDMLTFFSERYGVKYPWPKYAQTCVYDFGGGMENVSATTLIVEGLADARSGLRPMASLNSHELGHQWFGDLVTCRDWGEIWLNESFATFLQMTYFEHGRGKDAYDMGRWYAWQSYFDESKRYKRPIVTRFYPNADSMFDSHAYPKGGIVLHALRKTMGDDAFFVGLKQYLTANAYKPVDTTDLIRALVESSGQNVEPFFDQWVFKPGHPVLENDWSWDASAKTVKLRLTQRQDTKDGTPIYQLELPIGIVSDGKLTRHTVSLTQREQTFTFPSDGAVQAVLIDTDRDFPIEHRGHWHRGEAEATLAYAPCAIDRFQAAEELVKTSSGAARVLQAADTEPSSGAAVDMIFAAANRKDTKNRAAFRVLIAHADAERRAAAVYGLGKLPETPEDTATLRGLVNDAEPYRVVTASLAALAKTNTDANLPILQKAVAMPSLHHQIAIAAAQAVANGQSDAAFQTLTKIAEDKTVPRPVRLVVLESLRERKNQRAQTVTLIQALQKDEDPKVRQLADDILKPKTDPSDTK